MFHRKLSWRWKALIPLVASTVLGMMVLMHYVSSLRLGIFQFHLLVVLVVVTLALVMLEILLVQV